MATLQELTHQQIEESIRAGAERTVPATVTIRDGSSWANLQSRLMGLEGEHLLIAMPVPHACEKPRDFAPADKIGLSFKLKHHKHIFTATVAGVGEIGGNGTPAAPGLRVCWPTRMHRMQRRAFLRVDVPPSRLVRASFWLGGSAAEPSGTSVNAPVWSGRVTNLSAGGFQLLTQDRALESLEVGDTVGVHLMFGAGGENVSADAQFRHVDRLEEGLMMGFQFLGLAQTPQGRKALHAISGKVGSFHRMLNPVGRRRA